MEIVPGAMEITQAELFQAAIRDRIVRFGKDPVAGSIISPLWFRPAAA
jgi:hypothetical protein